MDLGLGFRLLGLACMTLGFRLLYVSGVLGLGLRFRLLGLAHITLGFGFWV